MCNFIGLRVLEFSSDVHDMLMPWHLLGRWRRMHGSRMNVVCISVLHFFAALSDWTFWIEQTEISLVNVRWNLQQIPFKKVIKIWFLLTKYYELISADELTRERHFLLGRWLGIWNNFLPEVTHLFLRNLLHNAYFHAPPTTHCQHCVRRLVTNLQKL